MVNVRGLRGLHHSPSHLPSRYRFGSRYRFVVTYAMLAFVCLCFGALTASGDDGVKPRERQKDAPGLAFAGDGALTAESEEAVWGLVNEHLPSLATMLMYLKENAHEDYQRAMRDLLKQVRRLESSRRRGDRNYELELQAIKVETRIDMTAAKLRLNDQPGLRTQLRGDLRELQQLRIERLQLERDTAELRVQRAKEQLASADRRLLEARQTADATAEKAFEMLLRKTGRLPISKPTESSKLNPRPSGSPSL